MFVLLLPIQSQCPNETMMVILRLLGILRDGLRVGDAQLSGLSRAAPDILPGTYDVDAL